MPHLTRRTLFASAAVMAGGAALAQSAPPARTKGPPVWLDLDQKELDDAYDQSVYAPNLRQITGRYVTNSEAVRARIGAPKRLAYGSTPIEGLDLYATKRMSNHWMMRGSFSYNDRKQNVSASGIEDPTPWLQPPSPIPNNYFGCTSCDGSIVVDRSYGTHSDTYINARLWHTIASAMIDHAIWYTLVPMFI